MKIRARDNLLIREVLGGDNSAFDVLYRHYHPQVYAMVARRTGDREMIDDIVQITFMRAYCALSRFRGQSNFATWLIQIALNACTSHHRTQRVRQA
jgi:RNA polymerase sigma-70 factor (ECF subfamily)